ncbi:5'-nucleotidase C-terminal domain-containing protein [Bacillaceae bacterium S4-13-56]
MNLKKLILSSLLALAMVVSGTTAFAKEDQSKNRYISVQLLGINDFHGQIDVTRTVDGKKVGGADYLAAYLKKRANKNTLIVHAGDVVGASSPTSSLLNDEPTIKILNKIGFDVGTLGNHEFDRGTEEMMRLINGGPNPDTGEPFEGAQFPYVVANVVDKQTGKPILPPYTIKKVNGMPIGFIGVVTTETPSIVIPTAVENITFTDEVKAINKATKELKSMGVESIVVLAHVSGSSEKDGSQATGEIVNMASEIDDEVDVIFGGHNHGYLNTTVDGKLLVQSYSYGTAFSDVDLEIDPKTKDIVKKDVEIVTTFHEGITPDPEVAKIVEEAKERAGEALNEVVGQASEDILREQNPAGESALGDLIADAQRKAMNSEIAVMNPGGIRDNIYKGEITWGDLYTVQPFNNILVKMDLTGQQIINLLNQQWREDKTIMLQISGLKYTWDDSIPYNENRIVDITINGEPIDPNATYSVTANNFLAAGGDGFTVLTEGTNQATGPTDIDALVDFVEAMDQPISYDRDGRIQLK